MGNGPGDLHSGERGGLRPLAGRALPRAARHLDPIYPPTILSGRPRRRLPPPAALRSVNGRLRKAASLARLADDEIRSAMPCATISGLLWRTTTPNREEVFRNKLRTRADRSGSTIRFIRPQ